MAIHNESERRRAEEQAEYLRSELGKIPASEQEDEVTTSVINGLRMQISDIENELTDYSRLKKGLERALSADNFDDIGELIIKARIARGWSQADLARELEMEPQQVQRYERNDWQKISLWRLQEVVEALNLDIAIHARLRDDETQEIGLSPITVDYDTLRHRVVPTMGEGIDGALGISHMAVGGGVDAILGSGVHAALQMKPDTIYGSPKIMSGFFGGHIQAMTGSFQTHNLGLRKEPTSPPYKGKKEGFELANSVA